MLVEQVEGSEALAKGLVKREVVRVVTPGVVLDDDVLEPKSPRYLAGVVATKQGDCEPGLHLDASTGELAATELPLSALADELARIAPREVIATKKELDGPLAPVRARYRAAWNVIDQGLAGAGPSPWSRGLPVSTARNRRPPRRGGGLRRRLRARYPAHRHAADHRVARVHPRRPAVVLDEAAIANLELTETLIGKRKQGSLLEVIDATVTAPGGRLLRRWLTFPLRDVARIRRRQDAVAWLVERPAVADQIRKALAGGRRPRAARGQGDARGRDTA